MKKNVWIIALLTAGNALSEQEKQAHCGSYEGYDHGGQPSSIEVSAEMRKKAGIELREAKGRTIVKSTVFPAEIKLNRDRIAAVSARYASIVRQMFAEISDVVEKGDILASLENRETLAVYDVAAPQNGVIISKDASAGETVTGEKELFEIADLSTVWADISIFPKYQHMVRKGMPVKFIAHDGHTARGAIKYISPIISHKTRTFTARCVLEGAKEDFTPGALVRARIAVETAEVDVAVSFKAIQTLENEQVIFVPEGRGFVTVPVRLGLADDRFVEVVSGLKPGGQYVADGAFILKAEIITGGMDPHAGHGH